MLPSIREMFGSIINLLGEDIEGVKKDLNAMGESHKKKGIGKESFEVKCSNKVLFDSAHLPQNFSAISRSFSRFLESTLLIEQRWQSCLEQHYGFDVSCNL